MHRTSNIASPAADSIVAFEGVSHRYTLRKGPSVAALDDVSFSVPAGRITAIVGPNGSGKTTVFKLINGLLPLKSGRITVNGYDVTQRSKIQREVGVVFQSPSLDPQLRVRENLAHYSMLYGLKLTDLQYKPVIEMMNIADVLDRKVETLSGGYQRRIELAKVLLTNPKTVILDEPFSGLDADAREKFFGALQLLVRDKGISVLLITHMLHIASRCDEVIVLDSGKVLAHETPQVLTSALGDAVIEIHSFGLQKVLDNVRTIEGITLQQISATGVLLTGVSLHSVLSSLNGASATIQQIESRKPSLEDYFQSATGKRYATGGATEEKP